MVKKKKKAWKTHKDYYLDLNIRNRQKPMLMRGSRATMAVIQAKRVDDKYLNACKEEVGTSCEFCTSSCSRFPMIKKSVEDESIDNINNHLIEARKRMLFHGKRWLKLKNVQDKALYEKYRQEVKDLKNRLDAAINKRLG